MRRPNQLGVIGTSLTAWVVWASSVNCPASTMPAPRPATELGVPGGASAGLNRSGRPEAVTVEPEGWELQGFRYRIVLNADARGRASSLDVTAEPGGLRVIARDVDGIGGDLDLIVESARSLALVGVWINDHHGGFIKADARACGASVWSERPVVRPGTSPDSLQLAVRPPIISSCFCRLGSSLLPPGRVTTLPRRRISPSHTGWRQIRIRPEAHLLDPSQPQPNLPGSKHR